MTVDVGTSKVNERTLAMLNEVSRLSGRNLRVTQGYNPGGVAASAGTHDGWGVVDLSVVGMTVEVRNRVRDAFRAVGGASWVRLPDEGNWPTHIHTVCMGDPGLSPAARAQVTAYRQGRNGLKNNGPDVGARQFINVTWERYVKAHQASEVDEVTKAESDLIAKRYALWQRVNQLDVDIAVAKSRNDTKTVQTLAPFRAALEKERQEANDEWEALNK